MLSHVPEQVPDPPAPQPAAPAPAQLQPSAVPSALPGTGRATSGEQLVAFLAAADDGTRAESVLALQRTAGNRAVARMLARAPLKQYVEENDDVTRWIRRVNEELDAFFTSERKIVTVFREAAAAGKFVALHDRIDMARVFAALDPAKAVEVGLLGPATNGRDVLNRHRADYIVELAGDSGVRAAEIYAHRMFRGMYDDDTVAVLKILQSEARLATTIALMPQVQAVLRDRGIEPKWWSDRPAEAGDFARGAWEALKHGAYAHNRPSSMAQNLAPELPEEYREALRLLNEQETRERLAPANVMKGSLDYATLGISSAVAGLATDTPKGLYHLATGDLEQAGAELVGILTIIATWGIAKGAKALRAEPVNHVMPEYTGPKAQALSRLEAILARSPSSGTAAQALAMLSEAELVDAGRYVKGRSANAVFVARGGLPALKALIEAGGDLRAAQSRFHGRKTLPPGPEAATTASKTTTPDPLPAPEQVRAQLAELPEADLNRLVTRVVRGDAKGRKFGTPRNPRMPTVEEFNPRATDVPSGAVETLIKGEKHGLFPKQAEAVRSLSNEELVRFRIEDPISGAEAGGGFSLTGGHHRIAEIIRRAKSGELPPDTPVRILLHD